MATTTCISPDAPAASSIGRRLRDRVQEMLNRRALARMSSLDDHMLRDMGLTGDDVRYARNLPLSVDAGVELHRISLTRRSNM